MCIAVALSDNDDDGDSESDGDFFIKGTHKKETLGRMTCELWVAVGPGAEARVLPGVLLWAPGVDSS